jgi:hypothetical protein
VDRRILMVMWGVIRRAALITTGTQHTILQRDLFCVCGHVILFCLLFAIYV